MAALQAGADGKQCAWSIHEIIGSMQRNKFFGPYIIICPEKKTCKSLIPASATLLGTIESKHLKGNDLIVLEGTHNVVQIVIGLAPVVVPWEDHYKLICILVPRIVNRDGIAVR